MLVANMASVLYEQDAENKAKMNEYQNEITDFENQKELMITKCNEMQIEVDSKQDQYKKLEQLKLDQDKQLNTANIRKARAEAKTDTLEKKNNQLEDQKNKCDQLIQDMEHKFEKERKDLSSKYGLLEDQHS